MKQTAVEWLNDEIIGLDVEFNMTLISRENYWIKRKELLEQAKEMEKQQHDVTFAAGYDYRSSKEKNIIEAFGMNSKPTFEQYYNETFKK
jgi:hypothetical protein